jgi:hypothetical protein
MTTIDANTQVENLTTGSRLVRLAIGAGLIGYTLTYPQSPLGAVALLPLLAIYPLMGAVIGWDPVKALFCNKSFAQRVGNLSPTVRLGFAVVGSAMIGSALVATAPATLIAALLGVYPITVAILGEEPVAALYNLHTDFDHDVESTGRSINQPQSLVIPHHGKSQNVDEHQDLAA